MRKFLIATAAAALLTTPVSAKADTVGDLVTGLATGIEKHADALWGFLGSKEIETGHDRSVDQALIAAIKPAPISQRASRPRPSKKPTITITQIDPMPEGDMTRPEW